ncbi:MAG TPA: response regulator [Methanobacterium subterraneum]|uniref:Response regulator n=2 Tax=Methanobacteriaceae TaxID=2159 RepID=A0A2H4VTF7_9EURY|nr:two-component system response regulator [Methanobacterium sp. MZ-A1]AUB61366.1 two-component system response regulator [Methanobacterium subterraneum]MBW4256895.1 response regulator [Methanobacterium sp. YSL]NMO08803.1 response regulator [Methanobacterium subterraneum]HII84323.1 response regulator [Methanobacterium subterraneum]
MLVEDEIIVAADVKNRLENMGYEVLGIFDTGEEAIEKAGELKPNLVLMDIVLKGDMDGIDAAQKIRELFDIPIIYLTAYSDEKTLQRAKVTEPFGYVLKPFEDREIQSAIEMAIYKHKMEQQLKESEEKYRKLIEKFLQVSTEILNELSKPK